MKRLDESNDAVGAGQGPGPGRKKSGFVYFRLSAACWLILVHELLERFSFYGMKGLLTLFLKDYLGFGSNMATSIYHLFTAVSYLLPVAGAIISDNFLGRFKTVVIFGVVYLVGHVMMPLTTLTRNPVGPLIGMFILAVGTGTIKPCVAAFGGDQTPEDDEEATDAFFSLFYLVINVGAFISQLLTPILKETVDCVDDQCYPLAFGVPAAAFLLTYVLFIVGRPLYRFVPGEDNVFVRSVRLMCHSVVRKFRLRKTGDRRDSVLDYGDDEYDAEFIDEVKVVWAVLILYLPFPIFWALFDQQGSRWSVQASQMEGRLTKGLTVYPEQMQMINPLLICIIIPLFNNVVYPLLTKCNVLTRPPSRMVVGYVFAAASFVYAALLQIQIDKALMAPELPAAQSSVRLLNLGPCDVKVQAPGIDATLRHGELGPELQLPAPQNLSAVLSARCDGASWSDTVFLPLADRSKYTIGLAAVGPGAGSPFAVAPVVQDRVVNRKGAKLRFLASPVLSEEADGVELVKQKTTASQTALNFSAGAALPHSRYRAVAYGTYDVVLRMQNGSTEAVGALEVGTGLVETVALLRAGDGGPVKIVLAREIAPELLLLPLQIPQYVLMTMGEVLFSVTSMSFAYSEAPKSMKAIMQSVYLVTIFFGNIIVTIVASLPSLPSQVWEYVLFAGLVLLAGVLQALLAWMFARDKAKRLARKESDARDANDSEGKRLAVWEAETDTTKL